MKFRRIQWLIAAVMVVAVGGAGFPRSDAQGVVQVTVGQAGDAPSMDPHKARGQFGGNVLFNLYEGLTTLSSTGAVEPALATSWKAITPMTWQFSLRHGVKFQNGVPFTSASVAYSFKRLMDPTKPRLNANFKGVARLDVVDDYTVNITTKGIDPWFPQKSSELFVVEPGHTEQVGDPGMAVSPVGTGPYRLAQWDHDQQVVLQAWPGYWRGKAKVDRLVFRVIPESTTRLAELLTGHVDLVEDVSPDDLATVRRNPKLRIETIPSKRTVYVGMNLLDWGPSMLRDVRVRQALNYAVDVPAIMNAVLGGLGRRNETVFRPDYYGYDPSITAYPHDPAKAKELLAEAGYPNGFSIGFLTSEQVITKGLEIAQAISGQLQQVGVNAIVKPVSLATFRSVVVGGQSQKKNEGLFLTNYGSSFADPNVALAGFLSTTGVDSFYASPTFDALLAKGDAAPTMGARKQVYHDEQVFLKAQAPMIFLFQPPDIWGASDRLVWKARLDQNVIGYEMAVR